MKCAKCGHSYGHHYKGGRCLTKLCACNRYRKALERAIRRIERDELDRMEQDKKRRTA